MEAVRDAWTDDRLDDLNQRVSDLDRRMEEGFREMREEFRAVRGEIGAMHRSITQLAFGLIGTMTVGFLGTIVTVILHG